MKKTNILAAAAMILALTACSSNETDGLQSGDFNSAKNNPNAPQFSATIGAQTRAYDTSWETNDAIGITGTSGTKTYTNVQYVTTAADGNFTVATAGTDIYFQDNSTVTFTAYYPWNASTAITADTKAQKNQKTFDYLWSQATGSKASRNVAFSFAHKMAKVVLTIKKGSDVDFNEVKNAILSLGGIKHNGSFDVADGTTTTTGTVEAWTFANSITADNNAPVAEDATNETVTYTLILFPQEFEAVLPFTAELTGIQSFAANLNFATAPTEKNELKAGCQYNLNVILNKTSLIVEGCTIQPWTPVNGDDVIAK